MFIEQGGEVVDRQINSPLDTDDLTRLVTFTSANNQKYSVVKTSTYKTVKRNALFTFFTSKQIKYDDITTVQSQLEQTWKTLGKFVCYIIRVFV